MTSNGKPVGAEDSSEFFGPLLPELARQNQGDAFLSEAFRVAGLSQGTNGAVHQATNGMAVSPEVVEKLRKRLAEATPDDAPKVLQEVVAVMGQKMFLADLKLSSQARGILNRVLRERPGEGELPLELGVALSYANRFTAEHSKTLESHREAYDAARQDALKMPESMDTLLKVLKDSFKSKEALDFQNLQRDFAYIVLTDDSKGYADLSEPDKQRFRSQTELTLHTMRNAGHELLHNAPADESLGKGYSEARVKLERQLKALPAFSDAHFSILPVAAVSEFAEAYRIFLHETKEAGLVFEWQGGLRFNPLSASGRLLGENAMLDLDHQISAYTQLHTELDVTDKVYVVYQKALTYQKNVQEFRAHFADKNDAHFQPLIARCDAFLADTKEFFDAQVPSIPDVEKIARLQSFFEKVSMFSRDVDVMHKGLETSFIEKKTRAGIVAGTAESILQELSSEKNPLNIDDLLAETFGSADKSEVTTLKREIAGYQKKEASLNAAGDYFEGDGMKSLESLYNLLEQYETRTAPYKGRTLNVWNEPLGQQIGFFEGELEGTKAAKIEAQKLGKDVTSFTQEAAEINSVLSLFKEVSRHSVDLHQQAKEFMIHLSPLFASLFPKAQQDFDKARRKLDLADPAKNSGLTPSALIAGIAPVMQFVTQSPHQSDISKAVLSNLTTVEGQRRDAEEAVAVAEKKLKEGRSLEPEDAARKILVQALLRLHPEFSPEEALARAKNILKERVGILSDEKAPQKQLFKMENGIQEATLHADMKEYVLDFQYRVRGKGDAIIAPFKDLGLAPEDLVSWAKLSPKLPRILSYQAHGVPTPAGVSRGFLLLSLLTKILGAQTDVAVQLEERMQDEVARGLLKSADLSLLENSAIRRKVAEAFHAGLKIAQDETLEWQGHVGTHLKEWKAHEQSYIEERFKHLSLELQHTTDKAEAHRIMMELAALKKEAAEQGMEEIFSKKNTAMSRVLGTLANDPRAGFAEHSALWVGVGGAEAALRTGLRLAQFGIGTAFVPLKLAKNLLHKPLRGLANWRRRRKGKAVKESIHVFGSLGHDLARGGKFLAENTVGAGKRVWKISQRTHAKVTHAMQAREEKYKKKVGVVTEREKYFEKLERGPTPNTFEHDFASGEWLGDYQAELQELLKKRNGLH